ncbi:hypothetical protein BDY24DRAFT_164180 [Mrakia frigida]|uniref:uncharacterized protein n=1 Tax=Mrakia frigida TaxID=29902 RepID=UPI003FCC060F
MSLSNNLSSLSLSDPPPPPSSSLPLEEQASLLRQQANALFLTSGPSSAIPLYTSALALTPKSAPLLANRAQARLKTGDFTGAYQDAVAALDDGAEGMDPSLKVKCVVRAGEACVGGEIWDLAVIHFEEAKNLDPTSTRIASLRTQALNKLSRTASRPDLNQALMVRRTEWLKSCFPDLDEEDVEWEDESGSEEDDEEEDENEDEGEEEEGEAEEDAEMDDGEATAP